MIMREYDAIGTVKEARRGDLSSTSSHAHTHTHTSTSHAHTIKKSIMMLDDEGV